MWFRHWLGLKPYYYASFQENMLISLKRDTITAYNILRFIFTAMTRASFEISLCDCVIWLRMRDWSFSTYRWLGDVKFRRWSIIYYILISGRVGIVSSAGPSNVIYLGFLGITLSTGVQWRQSVPCLNLCVCYDWEVLWNQSY